MQDKVLSLILQARNVMFSNVVFLKQDMFLLLIN